MIRPMMRHLASLVAAVAFLIVPVPGQSQIASDYRVAVGTPLRVTPVQGPQRVAQFDAESAEGLRLRFRCEYGCDSLSTMRWSDLRRVDVQVRGPGSPKRAMLGGLIGGIATYLLMLGVASHSDCHFDAGSCDSLGLAIAAPAIAGGGALLGAIAGWTSARDRWEPVWPSGARR